MFLFPKPGKLVLQVAVMTAIPSILAVLFIFINQSVGWEGGAIYNVLLTLAVISYSIALICGVALAFILFLITIELLWMVAKRIVDSVGRQ